MDLWSRYYTIDLKTAANELSQHLFDQPQSNQPLREGTHVEIRVEPGDVPAGRMSEIEA